MDVLLHTDLAAFGQLEDAWNTLLRESGNTSIFSRHEYLHRWAASFLGERELFVVEMRREGRTVGFAPLLVQDRHFSMIGSFADYCGFVVSPGEEAIFIDRLLDLLVEQQAASLTFENLQEEGPVFPALVAACRRRRLACRAKPVTRAPVVAIRGDWDRYIRSLSRNAFRDLRKKLNRLDGTPELEVRLIKNQADFAVHFERMMEMHLRLWADRRQFTPYRDKVRRHFLREVGETMLGRGMLRLTCLSFEGHPIAYLWCYDHGGVRHYLNAAWDAAHSALSPGSLLLINDLRDAFTSGMAEYDLLGGGEAYKFRYATGQRHVTTLHLPAPTRPLEQIRPLGRVVAGDGSGDGNLLVVAHADDEAIFFGALLRQDPGQAWTCCLVTDSAFSPALGEQRLEEFRHSCRLMGLEPQRLEIEEPYPGQVLDPRLVADRLAERFSGRRFDAVYTHGLFGEYGHQHHAAVCLAVHRVFEGVYSVAGPLEPDQRVRETANPIFPDKVRYFENVYVSQGALIDLASPVEHFTRLETARVGRIYRLFFGRLPDGSWDPSPHHDELAEAAAILPRLCAAWFVRQPCPAEFQRAATPGSRIDVFTPLQCLTLETALGLAAAGGREAAGALAAELGRSPQLVMPGARSPAARLAEAAGYPIDFAKC